MRACLQSLTVVLAFLVRLAPSPAAAAPDDPRPTRSVKLVSPVGAVPAALSPDSKTAVMVMPGDRVLLFDTTTGTVRHSLMLRGARDTVEATRFSPDGSLVGVALPRGTVAVWETATGKQRKVVPGAPGAMSRMNFAIASDGRWVAGSGPESDIALFDLATGEMRRTLPGATSAFAFSPDGRLLAVEMGSSGSVTEVGVWEVGSTKAPRRVAATETLLLEVVFSPDGARLALCDVAGTVRVLDVASGKETRLGPTENATRLAFSPDGRRLITSGGPGMVWDAATGKLVFRVPGDPIDVARISADGRTLAALSYEAIVSFWELPR